jgi:hypothetical protein
MDCSTRKGGKVNGVRMGMKIVLEKLIMQKSQVQQQQQQQVQSAG